MHACFVVPVYPLKNYTEINTRKHDEYRGNRIMHRLHNGDFMRRVRVSAVRQRSVIDKTRHACRKVYA